MEKGGYVYILTNSTHSVLYAGVTNDIQWRVAAEKRIKKGSRRRKIRLIEHQNPEWRDLSEEWAW